MGQRNLETLYPFIYGKRYDPEALAGALRESIVQKARDARQTNEQFFAEQGDALIGAARAIADVYRRDGRLYTMGNGGSSCDAAHVAVEFSHPVTAGRPALPAIDLTADIAMISAVANDVGYEQVFARQLIGRARAGDGLLGISTSGNSENMLIAFTKAKELGLATIGLSGADGGRMKAGGAVDHCIVVPATSIHRIQECHVVAYHILWDLVHTLLADDRGSASTARSDT